MVDVDPYRQQRTNCPALDPTFLSSPLRTVARLQADFMEPLRSDAADMRRQVRWALAIVATAALAVRLPLLLGYPPVTYPDTGTYLQAALDLVSGDFSVGQGRRTPGYPLYIALLNSDPSLVVGAQLVGGVATSLLLATAAWWLTRSAIWAAVSGLAHVLNMQQLFQEGSLLTEALCVLSLAVTLVVLLRTMERLRGGAPLPLLHLLALGVLAAYTLFVRPQFICLLIVLPVTVAVAAAGHRLWSGRALAAAGLLLLPAISLVLAWCAVVQSKTGYFTLSTQSGFGMVNHPIDYIELAPQQYAQVRDVLVETRERRLAEVGHSRNTIWYAWPEIQRVTGWSLPEASRQLQAMCKQMFIDHPWRYARSVASAWVDFWTVPFFWKPEQVHPTVRSAVEAVWWVQHKLLRLANLAFVLAVAAAVAWPAFRRRVQWDVALSAIAATVLMSSLIQALADQGASSRYHLPTQSLVVLVLVVLVARWRNAPGPASRE